MSSRPTPRLWMLAVGVLLAPIALQASERPLVPEHPLGNGLSDSDRRALEFVAIHAESLHPSIFAVTERGEILVQLPALWQDFEVAVAPLLVNYSHEQQTQLQDLMRHPGLVEALATLPRGDANALTDLVDRYPEEIREAARTAALERRDLLMRIAALLRSASDALETRLAPLPAETRSAFLEVIGQPDLTATLLEHMQVSERLGGAYRVDAALAQTQLMELGRLAWAEQERREAAEAQRRETERLAAEQRARERSTRHWYRGDYGRWSSRCWYGDPWYDRHWGSWNRGWRRCWYPWHRYRRHWW